MTILLALASTATALTGSLLLVTHWVRTDGYGSAPRRAATQTWSVAGLPSHPYAGSR